MFTNPSMRMNSLKKLPSMSTMYGRLSKAKMYKDRDNCNAWKLAPLQPTMAGCNPREGNEGDRRRGTGGEGEAEREGENQRMGNGWINVKLPGLQLNMKGMGLEMVTKSWF